MSEYSCSPYGIQGEENYVLPPLFKYFFLQLTKRLVPQRLSQIAKQRESLLDSLSQFRKLILHKSNHHFTNTQPITPIDLLYQLMHVPDQ